MKAKKDTRKVSKKEKFLLENEEALSDMFDGVKDLVEASPLPFGKDDVQDDDQSFAEFCLWLADVLLSTVKVVADKLDGSTDDEEEAEEAEESSGEESLTEKSETESPEVSLDDVVTDSEDEEPVSEDMEEDSVEEEKNQMNK